MRGRVFYNRARTVYLQRYVCSGITRSRC